MEVAADWVCPALSVVIMSVSVAIYLFSGMEVLDFAGPYEVLTTAARVAQRLNPGTTGAFRVFTVAEELAAVQARAGLTVTPDFALDGHPAVDLLIVPGGVVSGELKKPVVTGWIKRTAAMAKITASVCTGASLLARAGVLEGKRATTHWEDLDDLQRDFPNIQVLKNRRWVDEGSVVTSGGISAGIDMSLHLVERLAGRELALATARQMEYVWNEDA